MYSIHTGNEWRISNLRIFLGSSMLYPAGKFTVTLNKQRQLCSLSLCTGSPVNLSVLYVSDKPIDQQWTSYLQGLISTNNEIFSLSKQNEHNRIIRDNRIIRWHVIQLPHMVHQLCAYLRQFWSILCNKSSANHLFMGLIRANNDFFFSLSKQMNITG